MAAVRFVDVNSPNATPPFATWDTAATTIQQAVDAAVAGDEIIVTNGVYDTGGRPVGTSLLTNRVAVDKPLTLRSVNGPQFTIIKGYQVPGTITGNGAIRCVYLASRARLSGFTLTNGATLPVDYSKPDPDYTRNPSGGGLWCESVSSIASNCVLVGNSAFMLGGGAYSGTLNNCTLTGNSAHTGAGAAGVAWRGDFCTLNNCKLTGNSAGHTGGGAVGCMLNNCALTGNSAGYVGGGVADGTLYNCTLTGNSANWRGGGAHGDESSPCRLYNCTLTLNSAESEGGGAYGGMLYNCILYFNRAPRGVNYFNSKLEYSCTSPLSPGAGNIDADPRLASATRLSSASPCARAGNLAHAQGVDIDGEPWAAPPAMGADQPGPTTGSLSVTIDTGSSSLVTGYTTSFIGRIAGAVRESVWEFGDGTALTNQPTATHAWSAPGVYTVRLTASNDTYPAGIASTLEVAVRVKESYYVNLANPKPVFPYRNWESAATNIQDAVAAGMQAGRVVWVTNGVYRTGAVEKAYELNRIALTNAVVVQSVNGPAVTVIAGGTNYSGRCAYVGNGSILSGFTLTQGTGGYGGGVFCEGDAKVVGCTLTNNSASVGGGAYRGKLYNCTLTGNTALGPWSWGGGSVDAVLYNCILTANSTWGEGGGASGGTAYNCVLIGNSARHGGGAYGSTLNNCTVIGNSASTRGGGVAGEAALSNCIVYFNEFPQGANWCDDCGDAVTFETSCTTPMPTNGFGNITNAPLFTDFASDNLRLQSNSPCINSGNNAHVSSTTDLDGNPRIINNSVDMGAYEYQGAGSTLSYSWLQRFGLPTDGSADATDPDADGLNTWQEWRCWTDPTDPRSFLRLLSVISDGANMIVRWQSVAGVTYSVERSTDLSATPRFTPLAPNVNGHDVTTSYTDTDAATAAQIFYRVSVP